VTTTPPPWQAAGLCHQERYSELWEKFFADTALERRDARNLCLSCPVRKECLRAALERKDIWGVWGGCDEAELRRALWVNANGEPYERCRYPHCPMCHARPSKLHVVGVCELPSGRKRERVECEMCGFAWRAQTSVAAVKSYWREKARARKAAIRAAAPKGRIRRGAVVLTLQPAPTPPERPVALEASATIRNG
jgi:hypothetical protein